MERNGVGGTGSPAARNGVGGTGAPARGGVGGTGAPAQTAKTPGGIGGTGVPVAEDGGVGGTGAPVADGTGIVGTITGFASICVNGLEVFYDENTPTNANGEPLGTGGLAIGQVVAIRITSYNVCYTKLLRVAAHAVIADVGMNEARTGPGFGRMAGAAGFVGRVV